MIFENLPSTNTPINANNLNQIINLTGFIQMFAGNTAPTGWLMCDGSAISRTTYSDLFTVIGTTYGSGDGSTTFNLPDLRGRVGVGYKNSDTAFDTLGETGGEKNHTLTVSEIPNFTLNVNVGETAYPVVNSAYSGATGWGAFNQGSASTTGAPLVVKNTNGGQAHNILQPYIVINYIIKI